MIKFRFVFLIITAQLLFSCVPLVPTTVGADFKPMPVFEPDPETLNILNMFVCNTPDAKMALADFNEASTIAVEGSETLRHVETTDCDGKVEKSTRRVELFDQSIVVNPNKELAQKLNFLTVENVRTCSTLKVEALNEDEFETLKTQNKTTVKPFPKSSSASVAGDAVIMLLDSPIKADHLNIKKLNVDDGNNIVKIRYFGKCLKYAEKIDDTKKDSENCLEAELVDEKQILLQVKITRKISPLPALKVNSCKTNPTP